MREISTLINAEVISIQEGKRLGTISQVVYDLAQGRLLGLILGKGPAESGVLAADLKTLGPDVVMVEKAEVARRLTELPELMQARRDPSRPPQQVVTDGGQRLGRLGRVYLDPDKLKILRFEISGGAWHDLTEGATSMPVMKGIIHGPDTIIVPNAALQAATEGGGLTQSVEKASEEVEKGVRKGASRLSQAMETGAEALKKTLATPLGKSPAPKAEPPEAAPAKPKRKSTTTKAAKTSKPASTRKRSTTAKKSQPSADTPEQ